MSPLFAESLRRIAAWRLARVRPSRGRRVLKWFGTLLLLAIMGAWLFSLYFVTHTENWFYIFALDKGVLWVRMEEYRGDPERVRRAKDCPPRPWLWVCDQVRLGLDWSSLRSFGFVAPRVWQEPGACYEFVPDPPPATWPGLPDWREQDRIASQHESIDGSPLGGSEVLLAEIVIWNFNVPCWLMCAVIAPPVVLLWLLGRRRIPAGHCQTCGYDLTGNVSGRCPECGTDVCAECGAHGDSAPHEG